MNKHGQSAALIGFLLLGLVVVFALYITAVPLSKVWDDISIQLRDPDAFGSDNRTVEEIEQVDSFITPAYDQLIFVAFAGIILVLLITAVFFTDHPIFIVFLIIGFIVIMIIASQIVNVADTAVRDEALDNKADDFNLATLIFNARLPIILLIAGLTSVIIIMSRSRGAPA